MIGLRVIDSVFVGDFPIFLLRRCHFRNENQPARYGAVYDVRTYTTKSFGFFFFKKKKSVNEIKTTKTRT